MLGVWRCGFSFFHGGTRRALGREVGSARLGIVLAIVVKGIRSRLRSRRILIFENSLQLKANWQIPPLPQGSRQSLWQCLCRSVSKARELFPSQVRSTQHAIRFVWICCPRQIRERASEIATELAIHRACQGWQQIE